MTPQVKVVILNTRNTLLAGSPKGKEVYDDFASSEDDVL